MDRRGLLQACGALLWLLLCSMSCTKKSQDTIRMDGSSTVFLISEAMAEEFQKEHRVRMSLGASGTGGGFKRLCGGQLGMIGASRSIKSKEKEACKAHGVHYLEIPIAHDGIVIAVSQKNSWLSSITSSELKKMWEPAAQDAIVSWNQINPSWPASKFRLFSPGVDSGTYDYFTEAIVGKSHASRGDMSTSEDDNTLVQGVSGDKNALGFFGYAYYNENQDTLKALGVIPEGSNKPVIPSLETISDGSYKPLSRMLYLYINDKELQKPTSRAFIEFYLQRPDLIKDVGYVPLKETLCKEGLKQIAIWAKASHTTP